MILYLVVYVDQVDSNLPTITIHTTRAGAESELRTLEQAERTYQAEEGEGDENPIYIEEHEVPGVVARQRVTRPRKAAAP